MARSRDPASPIGRKSIHKKSPETTHGFRGLLSNQDIWHTSPGKVLLLVTTLRGVTTRISGGVLGELIACIKHGFTPNDAAHGNF